MAGLASTLPHGDARVGAFTLLALQSVEALDHSDDRDADGPATVR